MLANPERFTMTRSLSKRNIPCALTIGLPVSLMLWWGIYQLIAMLIPYASWDQLTALLAASPVLLISLLWANVRVLAGPEDLVDHV